MEPVCFFKRKGIIYNVCVQECTPKMLHQVLHILFCSSHKGLEGRKGADEFKFLILGSSIWIWRRKKSGLWQVKE